MAYQRQGVAGIDFDLRWWLTTWNRPVFRTSPASTVSWRRSHVLRFDRRGCGVSGRPAGCRRMMPVADIRAVMDAASADRVVPAGDRGWWDRRHPCLPPRPERVRP